MPPEVTPARPFFLTTKRRTVAKKSAPSRLFRPPKEQIPARRSESPQKSLEEKLSYIDRFGVNQFKGCIQCQESGFGNRCFLAQKISPKCGNCLLTAKECHFDKEEEEEEDQEMVVENGHKRIVQEDDVVITRTTKTTGGRVCPHKEL